MEEVGNGRKLEFEMCIEGKRIEWDRNKKKGENINEEGKGSMKIENKNIEVGEKVRIGKKKEDDDIEVEKREIEEILFKKIKNDWKGIKREKRIKKKKKLKEEMKRIEKRIGKFFKNGVMVENIGLKKNDEIGKEYGEKNWGIGLIKSLKNLNSVEDGKIIKDKRIEKNFNREEMKKERGKKKVVSSVEMREVVERDIDEIGEMIDKCRKKDKVEERNRIEKRKKDGRKKDKEEKENGSEKLIIGNSRMNGGNR